MKRLLLCFAILVTLVSCGDNRRVIQTDDFLVYHNICIDAEGKIVPWNSPDLRIACDDIVDRLYSFWKSMSPSINGLPYYMVHLVWKEGFEDRRSVAGDQCAMIMSSWRLLYQYLGDENIKEEMKFIADYYLTHSLSPENAVWPNIPYPYATKIYSGFFDGDMILGKGYLQPDKAGSFGYELTNMYRITGNREYLKAAVAIADCLVKNIRPADNDHSPWPFKVNALTGEVGFLLDDDHNVTARSEYTTNYAPTLELFLALKELNVGNVQAYMKTFDSVVDWLNTYPLATGKWGPFFEDVPGWSDTQINAISYASLLLRRPELFDNAIEKAESILGWVNKILGNDSWSKYGVTVINEQTAYAVPGNSHTARQAYAEILLASLKGTEVKQETLRKIAWTTYMVSEKGENYYYQNDIWLTDGYGDFIRHYLRAMDIAPELLANPNENHILSSTSVIKRAEYSGDLNRFRVKGVHELRDDSLTALAYMTSDSSGIERIVMTKKPSAVVLDNEAAPFADETDATVEKGYWTWRDFETGGGLLVVTRFCANDIRVDF